MDAAWDESEKAITPTKLLSKTCFARYGEGLATRSHDLLKDMYKHLRAMPERPITYQTIYKWFSINSLPQRENSLVFLQSYIINRTAQNSAEYNDVRSKSMKKVKSQLLAFLRNEIGEEPSGEVGKSISANLFSIGPLNIYSSAGRRVSIDLSISDLEKQNGLKIINGTYLLIRARMLPAIDEPITQEVLQIFLRNRESRFKLHYLYKGVDREQFEGTIAAIGSSILLIGASNKDDSRTRIIQIRNILNKRSPPPRAMWGVMLSDLPNAVANEPVACRVVLLRPSQADPTSQAWLNSKIRNLSLERANELYGTGLIRLVNNSVSALSQPGGYEPITNADGSPVSDTVLRVSQETLEQVMIEVLSKERAWRL